MSSLPVNITFANPPEGTCPATFSDAVTLLQALVSGEISTSYLPYVLGSTTPAVEDQDKAWIRTDVSGRPLGTFLFYAGSWRRQYNGKFNEMTLFNGNPALFFDGTGRGLTNNEWDGWAICNGQNGTPNLTDKFIVTAHMDNSDGDTGYSAGWRTKVSGTITSTGGAKEHLLVPRNLPELDLQLDGFEYNPGGSPHADAQPIIDKLYSSGTSHSVDLAHYGFDSGLPQTQTTVPTLPPYYALCICVFIGYA